MDKQVWFCILKFGELRGVTLELDRIFYLIYKNYKWRDKEQNSRLLFYCEDLKVTRIHH